MKRRVMVRSVIFVLFLMISGASAVSVPVTNGEFDQGNEWGPSADWAPPGWARSTTVNRVANYPEGSMDFWDEQFQFEESHVRFGWNDGGKLWQNLQVATLPTIEADTVYTLTVRARVSVDSPTVGVGIELNDATNWEDILTEFFYDTSGTDWSVYTVSFDTSDPAYSGFVGNLLASAVQIEGESNWMSVDYVRLDATSIPEPATIALLGLGFAAVSRVSRKK